MRKCCDQRERQGALAGLGRSEDVDDSLHGEQAFDSEARPRKIGQVFRAQQTEAHRARGRWRTSISRIRPTRSFGLRGRRRRQGGFAHGCTLDDRRYLSLGLPPARMWSFGSFWSSRRIEQKCLRSSTKLLTMLERVVKHAAGPSRRLLTMERVLCSTNIAIPRG